MTIENTPLDTKLPHSFDLYLDVKTMEQLIDLYTQTKETMNTINELVQIYGIKWDGKP